MSVSVSVSLSVSAFSRKELKDAKSGVEWTVSSSIDRHRSASGATSDQVE